MFFGFHTEQKILLGSVQRVEVIALLERHIGEERRLEVVAKRHMETRYLGYISQIISVQSEAHCLQIWSYLYNPLNDIIKKRPSTLNFDVSPSVASALLKSC
jgi:hypothetical protein